MNCTTGALYRIRTHPSKQQQLLYAQVNTITEIHSFSDDSMNFPFPAQSLTSIVLVAIIHVFVQRKHTVHPQIRLVLAWIKADVECNIIRIWDVTRGHYQ